MAGSPPEDIAKQEVNIASLEAQLIGTLSNLKEQRKKLCWKGDSKVSAANAVNSDKYSIHLWHSILAE